MLFMVIYRYRKGVKILTLNKIINILKKYEKMGLGDCNIFIDENIENNEDIDKLEILYNAEFNTIDIKYFQ